MSAPRVVIGSARPLRVVAKVCEFSIKRHRPDAEIIHTHHKPFLKHRDDYYRMGHTLREHLHRDRWGSDCEWIKAPSLCGTLFSFCRIMVPEICGFEGEAIYIDADKVIFGDIGEVWDLPMDGASILRLQSGQFSVLKIDCAALRDWPLRRLLSEGRRYGEILNAEFLPSEAVRQRIPNVWNQLDRWSPATKLLHYTCMRTQPWAVPGHPHGSHWFDALADAVDSGFISLAEVLADIREQDVRIEWQAAIWPQPHVVSELKKRGIS